MRMRMIKVLRPWSSLWQDRADGLLEDGGGVHLRIESTALRELWLAEPLSLAVRSDQVGVGDGVVQKSRINEHKGMSRRGYLKKT